MSRAMVQVARVLKSWFGIEAIILTMSFGYAIYVLATGFETGTLLARFHRGVEIILIAVPCFAVVSGMAWWKLRRGMPSAWLWAMAASIMNLPLLGIGTLAGIAGLVVFWRRDIAASMIAEIAKESAQQGRYDSEGKTNWTELATVLAQVFIFLAGKMFWKSWGDGIGLADLSPFGWIVVYETALLTAIACHEAGHLVAGWLTQMKLRKFVVGPFEWTLHGTAWKFQFKTIGLLGRGLAAMAPLHLKNLPGRTIFMMMGGPMGSLLMGSLATLATISAKGHAWQPAWQFLSAIATIGLGQFLVNLIPLKPELGYSDGAQIYQLASHGRWADVHLAFSMVSSTSVTSRRPRDYDIALLERAARFLTQGPRAVLLRLFACFHFLDAGQRENALAALHGAAAACPPRAVLGTSVSAEFVFLFALYQRDAAQARAWWDRMTPAPSEKMRTDYWRACSALHWVDGRVREARITWQTGEAIARAMPEAGAYDFDRWCFAELKEAIDHAEAMAPPGPGLASLKEALNDQVGGNFTSVAPPAIVASPAVKKIAAESGSEL